MAEPEAAAAATVSKKRKADSEPARAAKKTKTDDSAAESLKKSQKAMRQRKFAPEWSDAADTALRQG